jgi:beta-mannosidase
MAKQSNINMLRVWGGGIYGSDDFYDLCDSLGILVWQDFMFAGTVYPGDPAFVDNVRQEARQQVIRLRNHPSLALWCGNNEVDEAWHNWGWQKALGYSKSDSTKLWNDYLHLFEGMLPQIVDEYNPGMVYVPSSPATGWGREEAYRHGDVHYWGVWWGEEPFESFNAKVGRFVSEYGFQGMPDPKTIDSFTWPEDRNPDSEVMAVHQKHARGKELIHSYMKQDYRVPKNFEDYIYVSQLLQARGIKMAIEAHRRGKPYNMGTLYWQLNDCWPVTSWSGIDYDHRWKAMQYAVKKNYDQFLVSFVETNDSLEFWVVSDCSIDRAPELRWQLIAFKGDTLEAGQTSFSMPAGSSVKAIQLSLKDLIGTGLRKNRAVLKASVWDGQERLVDGLHYFDKPKNLLLDAAPGLTFEVEKVADGYVVTLSTRHLAKNVWIQSNMKGPWSDNFFDVLPGERIRVACMSDTTRSPVIKLRSLGEID